MKQLSIFNAQKSMSSQILCCASGGSRDIQIPTKLGRTELQESDPRKATEITTVSMENRLNSSGTSSQDSQRCISVIKSMIYCATWQKHQKLSHEEFYVCQCSMTSPVTEKSNKEECLANARIVKVLAKKFGIGQWSFIGPSSEKKWNSVNTIVHKEHGIISRKKCCWNSQKSGHPIFRATTPLSRRTLKNKGHGKLSIHITADYPTIETIFRIIVSSNQLSLYGAVANICEEFETHQDRSGEPDVLMGQSIVLGEIKADIPLQNENPSHHQILWQQYIERIESLSPESKVSRFCLGHDQLHARQTWD